jgi:hypothetical protein
VTVFVLVNLLETVSHITKIKQNPLISKIFIHIIKLSRRSAPNSFYTAKL